MKWLVLVHVLSAILGVGPTYFSLVLLKSNQNVKEFRHSIRLFKKLELFPKIGGTLAVLSGIALVWIGDYGSFMQLWVIGSLVLYIVIQIVIIGFIAPAVNHLSVWLKDPVNLDKASMPPNQQAFYSRARNLFWAVSAMGTVLFIFMILKPVFGG